MERADCGVIAKLEVAWSFSCGLGIYSRATAGSIPRLRRGPTPVTLLVKFKFLLLKPPSRRQPTLLTRIFQYEILEPNSLSRFNALAP